VPESKAEVEIQFRNRRLLVDALGVVPPWMFGAIGWVAFSELFLKRFYPDEFIALQTGLIGADFVAELPPGVIMVAALYDTLYLVEAKEQAVIDVVGFVNKIVIQVSKWTGI